MASNLVRCFAYLLALEVMFLPALAEGRPAAQEKQPLGSLSSVGQVYVSNSVAPAESTIFTGDMVRTNATSTATFTMSGKGSFQIASGTQVLFTGNQQYVAQLQSGILVMSSASGPTGINLRIGNFLLVMVTQEQTSSARVESAVDGSFRVSCLQGSVGIVPLEGPTSGTFLQAGQSATISAQGTLSTQSAVATSATSPAQPSVPALKNSHKGWIILGIAGAGGAAGAAAALANRSSGQPVSPSVP